jgi:F0F1-type ATP synthase membrane subunit b/b'
MLTKILIVLVVLLATLVGMLILNKKGVIKDEDNDFIPDAAEEAFEKTKQMAKKETKARIKEMSKEAGDVVDAFKEVGNQIGDIPKAAAGKKRSGRKPQK